MKQAFTSLLFILHLHCFSQVLTIEQYRLQPDSISENLIGHADFSFQSRKQQNDVLIGGIDANAVYLDSTFNTLLFSQWQIQQVRGADVVNNGYIHLRFVLLPLKRFNIEQFSQLQYDFGLGLEKRVLTGAALRKEFIKKPNIQFSANVGLMYEHEEWLGQYKGDIRRSNNDFLKTTINLTYTQRIHEKVYFFSTFYYQAKPTLLQEPRLVTNAHMKFNITSTFSIKMSYNSTYDANAFVDVAEYYHTIITAFSYTF